MKRRRALLLSITVVFAMCAACGWWLHRERQQYALNRQLIDVLEHGDTTRALTLVNAGADPNTRELATPAPSLQLLFRQFLSHKPPVNSSDTAFMLACGAPLWRIQDDLSRSLSNLLENVSLIEAMLTHHAHVNAKAVVGVTALYHAISDDRLRTVELLLQHGADVNARDSSGNTPLILACALQQKNQVEMVRLLLRFHADVNYVNRHMGSCALDFARKADSPNDARLIHLLKQAGAKENLPGRFGG